MKKKTNKKFTASKKSLVLSLACVSVLATVANAANTGIDTDGSKVKGDANVVINSELSGGTLNLNNFSGSSSIGVTINFDIKNGITNSGASTGSSGLQGTITNNATIGKGADFGDITFSGGGATISNKGTIDGNMTFGKLNVSGSASATGAITNGGTINGDLIIGSVNVNANIRASGSGISVTNGGAITGGVNISAIDVNVSGGALGADFVFENTAEGTIGKDVNVSKINIESKGVAASGGFANVDIKNGGTIKGSINLNGEIKVTGPMANDSTASAVASVINSGTLGGINLNSSNVTATSGGAFEIINESTGSITDFVIGKSTITVSDSGSVDLINKGTITNWINNGSFSDMNLLANTSGGITILNEGIVENFTNNVKIDTKTGFENSGNITNFTNSKTGFISRITNADATANAYIGKLNNAGTITTIVNGGTSLYGTINTIVNTGSIGSGANTAAGVANNAGSVINTIANYGNIVDGANFSGANAAIYNLGSIGTIINSNKFMTESPDGSGSTTTSTNAKIGYIVSDNSGGSGASIGLIDNQGGTIGGIINKESSITTIKNTGTINSIIATGSTTNNAAFGTIANLDTGVISSLALSGGATITSVVNEGVIGNKNAQNATSDAISMKSGANSIASLINTGSINGNINLSSDKGGNNTITTLDNSGKITGKIILATGDGSDSSMASIATLTNYETGSIGEILVGNNGSGGHIETLNNYGTITNGITIANGSGSIVNLNNYSTLGNVDTGKAGLTNNNTIDNLRNYETGSIVYAGTGTINKLLDNKGTIALANSANSISLKNGVRVNNSGVITGSQDGAGAILLASGGAAISINNTGLVNAKNYKQSQIGVDGSGASANIEAWKLTLNESTSTFNNTPGYTYKVSDERYLSGTFIPAEVTPPTDGSSDTGATNSKGKWVFTTISSGANTDSNKMNANSHIYVSKSNDGKFENVNFLDKSIVLDLSTQGFEIGQVYNMDNLVYGVDSGTGLLTGIGSAEWTIKDNGSGNGTLVYELDSGASSVNGGRGLTSANLAIQDDIYTISDTFIDTITSEKGDGKRVRGFSIGVDVANGAGALLAQGLTNVSTRRSLFIDSITSTVIQATIDQTSRTQQVSYNDSDVNFENLAKYAHISTDAYSATSNRDTYFYAIPYYTADSTDLQGGFEKLKGNTYGLVAGAQKNLYDAGIVGIFFGFESGSYDTSARFTSYNQDDLTFYGGLNYYKVLGGTENREYYVKAMAKAALISSDISRSTTAGSGTGDASVDSANFGAGVDLGINFYLTDAHVISPEIGISYDRLNTDSFVIGNQYYEESDANLLQGKIGFNWLVQWSPVFSTNFGAGIKNNFTGDIDTSVRIDNSHISQTVDLPSTYQYVQGGLSYMITNNIEVSLNYNGNYSSNTSSHSGLLRLGMWW